MSECLCPLGDIGVHVPECPTLIHASSNAVLTVGTAEFMTPTEAELRTQLAAMSKKLDEMTAERDGLRAGIHGYIADVQTAQAEWRKAKDELKTFRSEVEFINENRAAPDLVEEILELQDKLKAAEQRITELTEQVALLQKSKEETKQN